MSKNQQIGTQATMVMAGFIALMVLPVQIASALILSLVNGTSQANYEDTELVEWRADGVNQLTKASTYVKVDGLENCATESDGYFLLETSGCFERGLSQLLDRNADGYDDSATFYYNSADFAISINYELEGPVEGAFPTSIKKTVNATNIGADRNFDVVNYYDLNFDAAYVDPNSLVASLINVPDPYPETLLGTIDTIDGSVSAYEVGSNFDIAALKNTTGPEFGASVAYQFSEALASGGTVSLSQNVTIEQTSVFNAPRVLIEAATYDNSQTRIASGADGGFNPAEVPESEGWLSLLAIPALVSANKLTRWLKGHFFSH